ncbi:MAG: hypothetical protein NTY98_02780 [Verrucomicrobia bacterium]|nr:hypothetical protein [Verrucomicrobiota bacterium]
MPEFTHPPHRQPPAAAPTAAPCTNADPKGLEKIRVDDADPRFVQHMLRHLRSEVADSPVAAALLAHVGRLPNKVTLKCRERGMSQTVTDRDGHVTLHLNPHEMTGATFSHEFAHVIQQAHTHHALQHHRSHGRQPTGADLAAAIMAGRDALHQIAPVKDERDPGPEHKENEAMRVSNIVHAERTAAQMQDLPAAQRTPAEFRRRQSRCESAPKHQHNRHLLPPGSLYGDYDFHHVKKLLGF